MLSSFKFCVISSHHQAQRPTTKERYGKAKEKARCNTELYPNLRGPLNNVKPSNFWGSHQSSRLLL